MDELDKKLFEDLNEKIMAPNKFEYIIKNALKEERKCIRIFKIAFTTCMIFAFTTGGVIAGQKIYESIWKEPERLESFYTAEGERKQITEFEKKDAITEENAKQIANEILKEYGYESEEIESLELMNNPVNYNLSYKLETKNHCIVEIDAINTQNYKFFSNVLYGNIKEYRGTKEELEKVVREFCNNHKIDLTGYELFDVKMNGLTEEDSYIWYFYFYKKYGNDVNVYEEISISIIPEINQIYWLIVEKNPFDDNEIIITEDDAKQIVLETEKNIPTGKEILDVKVNLEITKMNGNAYTRMNNYEQYYEQSNTPNYPFDKIIYYRTESLVRRAWMVTIEYDLPKTSFEKFYTYFVDATTGEIIGGSPTYYTNQISKKGIMRW